MIITYTVGKEEPESGQGKRNIVVHLGAAMNQKQDNYIFDIEIYMIFTLHGWETGTGAGKQWPPSRESTPWE